ncbi:UPF0258 protein KIAA1024-like [Labeo rohita]|uniref:UPF0258 protein KIAA1024-like n=1 Tax=Labeo rohita TaxID=84645 RepID=A0A498MCM3_LABRO|nr:UPF0258 protein KIAA1024-like [Labeo rohita]
MGPCLRAVQAVHLALQASSGMVLGQTVNGKEKEMEGKPSADSHVFEDRELEKHITPQTLKPKIKQNPLFSHISIIDIEESKSKPSWTIQDYDRHTAHGQLADYMKLSYY